MKLAIKFSNDYIYITEQKIGTGIKVQRCIRGKMPEGAFGDGIVVNTNRVAETIKELLREYRILTKKAVLCISGMDIIHKEIRIPKSAQRHVRGLLKNELVRTDALRNGYLFDYIPGEDGGEDGLEVYGVYLLPAELIRNYEQTLKRAGLVLERVEPISRSMEKLALLLGLEKRENLTILVDAGAVGIDILMIGAGMKSIYQNIQVKEENIEENVFIVSAIRNIAESTEPSERILNHLVDSVSKLIQFQSQNSRGRIVDQILLYGEMAEKEGFISKVEQRTGITCAPCRLPEQKFQFNTKDTSGAGMAYSALGAVCTKLVGEKKQLSFIQLPDEAETMTLKDRIPLLLGLVCLAALASGYAVLAIGNNQLERKTIQAEDRISEIGEMEEYQRRCKVSEEWMKLVAYNENCGVCIDTLEAAERFSTEGFTDVDALVPAGIRIEGYEYEGNTIRFRCIADNQDGPADFAKTVTAAGVFNQVTYTGFSAHQDLYSVLYYSFTLECSY